MFRKKNRRGHSINKVIFDLRVVCWKHCEIFSLKSIVGSFPIPEDG